MIENYQNYDLIKDAVEQVRASRISSKDEAIIWNGTYIAASFDNVGLTDNAEFSVYDLEDNLVHWEVVEDLVFEEIQPPLVDGVPSAKILIFRPGTDARTAGITRGQYRIVYSLFRKFFGSHNPIDKLYIKEISPSRTELRVFPIKTGNEEVDNIIDSNFSSVAETNPLTEENLLKFVVNFGDNKIFQIVNWILDETTDETSLLIKLYEPLPEDITEKDQFWISEEITSPVVEKIFLLGQEFEQLTGNILRPANFDVSVGNISGRSTVFENWNKIISSNATTSADLIDVHFSRSLYEGIDLNVDYTDYANFVHFSSAKSRLANFKYKMEQIEAHDKSIGELKDITTGASQSSNVLTDISLLQEKKDSVVNGLDLYERYLYNTSGSQYSSSLPHGVFLFNPIGEWPKTNNTSPYTLAHSTSSAAIDWYATQSLYADNYDRVNLSRLSANIPIHIEINPDNEDLITFINLMGQFYDIFWLYTKQVDELYESHQSINKKLSKDLTFHLVKSFGFDLENGNDYVDLWRYSLGTDITGSYHSGSLGQLKYSDITKEIWRRIYNNLPYILKSKGTRRSIDALLACYGIPSTILTVREYGGPDPRDFPDIQKRSSYIFDSFVHVLNFYSSQSVQFSWQNFGNYTNKPNTIEVRFRTKEKSFATQSILQIGNSLSIALYQSSSNTSYGQVKALISGSEISSSYTTFYDNDFYSVILTTQHNNHKLYVKKALSDRIIYQSSMSLTPTSSVYQADDTFYIGGDSAGTFGTPFSGSMMEFRLFQPTLSESVFDNHVRWPRSYNSNHVTSSYQDLVLRYSFDEAKDHSSDTVVNDIKANQTFTTPGTASGYTVSRIHYTPIAEEFAALTPNIGGGRWINNKIRFDDNVLAFGNLSHNNRAELSIYDTAPNDSPKLGIYFSPIDIINDDIIATFGGTDLLGFIGDPSDEFADKYDDLEEINTFYWEKYTQGNDYNKYINFINHYDKSLFDQLNSLIPARAKALFGVLIEPHILERSKIKWKRPSKEQLEKSVTLSIKNRVALTGSNLLKTVSPLVPYATQSGEIISYVATAYINYDSASTYYSDESQVLLPTEPAQKILSSSLYYETNRDTSNLYSGLKYYGTLNDETTTSNAQPAVTVTFTNPNTLKSTDIGPSKLLVE